MDQRDINMDILIDRYGQLIDLNNEYNELKNELFVMKSHIKNCLKFIKNPDNIKYGIYWNVEYKFRHNINRYFQISRKMRNVKLEMRRV